MRKIATLTLAYSLPKNIIKAFNTIKGMFKEFSDSFFTLRGHTTKVSVMDGGSCKKKKGIIKYT